MTSPVKVVNYKNLSDDEIEKLEIVEIRNEIIERDADNISILWKLIPMILYFFCAVSGYAASILFYILWNDLFRGDCPIWADLKPPSPKRLLRDMNEIIEDEVPDIPSLDWRRNVIMWFQSQRHCDFYYIVSLCSCIFSIIWLVFFSMCGKGGYDTRIFVAPWRIVLPAFLFHLIFTPIVLYVVHNVAFGYSDFMNNLMHVASLHMNTSDVQYFSKKCYVTQYYLQAYEYSNYNLCFVYTTLQIFSWMMAFSWLLGLALLLLRIALVNDFRLLKLTIYKQSKKKPPTHLESNNTLSENEKIIVTPPKKRHGLLFFLPE